MREEKCIVNITWDDQHIEILDNAYGMSREAFHRALKMNAKAENYSDTSRGQYGMGLKYAVVNLGEEYSIETTEFNSTEKFSINIKVKEYENDIEEVRYLVSECPKSSHFTRITILKPFKKLNEGKKKKKTKETKEAWFRKELSKIYKVDITEGRLDIYLNGEKIVYYDPEFLQKENGGEWFSTFNNEFNYHDKDYKYTGWIAILKTGMSS